MADSPARCILIVVGSSIRAEMADRPLAYYLREQLRKSLEMIDGNDADLAREFEIVVVADFRWMRDEPLQRWPSISLGGPGVNGLAQQWLENLPLALAVDDHYFIQMDPDLDEPHVSIWGMDNASTQLAVSVFLQRYGAKFVEHCLHHVPPDAPDSDDESGEDEED